MQTSLIHSLFATMVLLGSVVGILVAPLLADGPQPISFDRQIRPLLAENCLHCHGPDAGQRQADLRLDQMDSASGALIKGKPDESELIRRIASDDPQTVMPPPETGKRLTAIQVQWFRQWIAEGATYESHWAYRPIRAPAPPRIKNAPTKATEIDRFVLRSLQDAGLKLGPLVERQTLIRRATFDLTGLPPTWEEVQSFINDNSPDAYEKVLDRLLNSPEYGVRWGRHWLDIARYADTHGGAAIGFRKFPYSYTYRDYVVRSLNADIPYDQFILEQLAADQLNLPPNSPALAGLGFLTVGMQFRNPHDTIDDQIDVVTRGLMGLTAACARCHDHKYDAIPTSDYYSLYATLASSQPPKLLPEVGPPPRADSVQYTRYQEYQQELTRRRVARDDMAREQTAIMRGRLRMQVGLYLRELAKGVAEEDLAAAFLSFRTDDLRPHVTNRWRDYMAKMKRTDPVFGIWVQLAAVPPETFHSAMEDLVKTCRKENGEAPKGLQRLGTAPPKWNSRLLDAIEKQAPKSQLELADVYGQLFAEVHQQWMKVLIGTSLEAAAAAPVPDEDPKHLDANSAVNRQLRRHLYGPGTPTNMSEDLAVRLLNRPIHDNVRGRDGAIENLHLTSPGAPPRAMSLEESVAAGPFYIFKRGSPIARGKIAQPRFLSALSASSPKPFRQGQRRLGLAQAIVDPANPLTRRVVANWVWQNHFGVGLVRTPDDFGTRGEPPTHPDLLDYLATQLLQDGWSLKKLHRRIMLSLVYQQAAREDADSRRIDPDNQLLWRMPRRSLKLEAMRDAMLAVSGELNLEKGGRPFDFLAKPIVPKRSIYGFVNRDIISPLASTFDAANPNQCTAKRPETIVPQQTLFALNSDFIQDRAAALAAHPQVKNASDDRQRVIAMYHRALTRVPAEEELRLALNFVQRGESPGRWQHLAHVLLATNEFVFVD